MEKYNIKLKKFKDQFEEYAKTVKTTATICLGCFRQTFA